MSYVVIKTINGRRYRYLQRSYRVGKKVKTESTYLGPEDGGPLKRVFEFIETQRLSSEDRAIATAERKAAQIDEEQRAMFGETATERAGRERQEHLDRLHDLYGLKLGPSNPTPIDKEVPSAVAVSVSTTDEQANSSSEQAGNNDPGASADGAGQNGDSGAEAAAS